MTTPAPRGHSTSEEYLRRTAEAAEATRRNIRLIVWVFVGGPLLIGALVVMILIVGGVGSSISAQSEADAYEQVDQAYRDVGYSAPSYTTIQNQVSGVCHNLNGGMAQSDAAAAMAQGFGDLSALQAAHIVEVIADHVCSG